MIYRKLRLDHSIHQLQERQSAKYHPSGDNIGLRVHIFIGEEGSIAGPGHGVLKEVMKYHAVLTQLDLLAVHENNLHTETSINIKLSQNNNLSEGGIVKIKVGDVKVNMYLVIIPKTPGLFPIRIDQICVWNYNLYLFSIPNGRLFSSLSMMIFFI